MLIILANLFGELHYHLQLMDCVDAIDLFLGTAEALWFYTLLFVLIVVWSFADFAPLRPKGRFQQFTLSPMTFSLSLVAFIGFHWVWRATTSIGYHGQFETPLAVKVVTFGLLFLLPLLVLAKSAWAAYWVAKRRFRTFSRFKSSITI